MINLQPIAFDEWAKLHPEIIEQCEEKIKSIPCQFCDGDGSCECPECGDVHECRRCGGTGQREGDPIEEARKIYQREVDREKNLFLANRLLGYLPPIDGGERIKKFLPVEIFADV